MIEALAGFIGKLTFIEAQLLIAELGVFIIAVIFMIAKFPRLSGMKSIDKKDGEVTFYNAETKPKKRIFHRKPKTVKL